MLEFKLIQIYVYHIQEGYIKTGHIRKELIKYLLLFWMLSKYFIDTLNSEKFFYLM